MMSFKDRSQDKTGIFGIQISQLSGSRKFCIKQLRLLSFAQPEDSSTNNLVILLVSPEVVLPIKDNHL